MKKVLILSNYVGGLFNFRFELIERLLKESYKIYFSVPETIDDSREQSLKEMGLKHMQININRRGVNPIEDLKLIFKYRNIIKKANPDIILTYSVKPNIYGNLIANLFNIPSIMNITGLGTSLNSKLKYLIKPLYKLACKNSEVVFFQNNANMHLFLTNNIVNKNKAVLIPGSGVNTNKFKPQKKENNDKKIKFLFIGRIMQEKGIEEYLEVARLINNYYSNVEFQILGFFEESKYKKIIKESKYINYLGHSSDVRDEIKEVDCIINPSYHEGMSNVLLEGAAMAKPLIASNISGCKEIIDDDINGYLFEKGDVTSLKNKIIKFLKISVEERKNMGEMSRKKIIKEFDRNIVISSYIEEINNII